MVVNMCNSTYEDNLSQPIGTVSHFQETRETDYVKGNRDVILYYPYWVGGVYQFKDTGSDSKYYVSKEEAKELAEERFAYAAYTKGNGSLESGIMSERQYSFAYYVAADIPEAPSGKPVVKVTYKDGVATLTWNKITDADGYYIAFDQGNGMDGVWKT